MSADSYRYFYSSDVYRQLYNGPDYESDYDKNFYTVQKGERILLAVERALGRLMSPQDSILEIGAGGGWNLVAFQARGASVIGYDYSPKLTALGRLHGIRTELGSIEEAVSSEHKYNVVVLNHVLEHFLKPIEQLRTLRSLVRENGVLYVGVPATDYPASGVLQNAHTYYFTDRTLMHYLARAGWRAGTIYHEDPFAMHTVSVLDDNAPAPALSDEYRRSLETLRKNRLKAVFLQSWYKWKSRGINVLEFIGAAGVFRRIFRSILS